MRCTDPAVHTDIVEATVARFPRKPVMDQMGRLFTLLANETRLRLVLALAPHDDVSPELCVCDLAAVSGASVSMTSHQLRLLRDAGLVDNRREGKLALYRLTAGPHTHLLTDALEHAIAS